MTTSTVRLILGAAFAALPAVPGLAAEPDAVAISIGQAHNEWERGRQALDACQFEAARTHATAASEHLNQVPAGAVGPLETVRAGVASLRSELRRREELARRDQSDLEVLVGKGSWREAQLRYATAVAHGCAANLSGYATSIHRATERPTGYEGPAAHAGRTVKVLMILGSIGGSGWIVQQRLRKRGIL